MITDYTTLQASVAKWLNRRDLTEQIPEFVQLAEASIARRVRRRTRRETIALNAYANALPSECAELRSVRLVTSTPSNDKPLVNARTPEILAERRAAASSQGRPTHFAVVDGELLVVPAPDDAYLAELTYYERLVPLSASVQSNSVLAESPDVYLWGALLEAAPYLKHDERIPVWEGKFEKALAEIEVMRQREEMSASLGPVRIPVQIG
jgi:hypothetical protein